MTTVPAAQEGVNDMRKASNHTRPPLVRSVKSMLVVGEVAAVLPSQWLDATEPLGRVHGLKRLIAMTGRPSPKPCRSFARKRLSDAHAAPRDDAAQT